MAKPDTTDGRSAPSCLRISGSCLAIACVIPVLILGFVLLTGHVSITTRAIGLAILVVGFWLWWLVFRFLPGRRSDDSGTNEPAPKPVTSVGTADEKFTRRWGRLLAIAYVLGFSWFLVIGVAALVNSRLVAKIGISLPMLFFIVFGSMLIIGAFTVQGGKRKTFRTRLGLVGLGLFIVIGAGSAVLNVWFG
jgi:hypothetical protein